MKEWGVKSPGPYFVFSSETRTILASIDTSKVEKAQKPVRRASA